MKKALHLAITTLLFSAASNAQITKGKTLLGGTIAYGTQTAEYVNNNSYSPVEHYSFTLSPSIGKVVKDNLVVGLQGSFSSGKTAYENPESKTDYKAYGGGVFVRKYVPLLKSFYFFGQGTAGYSQSKSTQNHIGQTYNENKNSDVSLSLYPGLAYAITQKFHIEAGLNNLALIQYTHFKSESTQLTNGAVSSSEGSSFNLSTSLGSNAGFSIGFRFLL